MKYNEDDEIDREINDKINRHTMHKEDVDRYTLKHKHDKDLGHFRHMDEGY